MNYTHKNSLNKAFSEVNYDNVYSNKAVIEFVIQVLIECIAPVIDYIYII